MMDTLADDERTVETIDAPTSDAALVTEAARRAARAVPPLWPLASSVAVNPFLGQAHESLALTGARLARAAVAGTNLERHDEIVLVGCGRIRSDFHAPEKPCLRARSHPSTIVGVPQKGGRVPRWVPL